MASKGRLPIKMEKEYSQMRIIHKLHDFFNERVSVALVLYKRGGRNESRRRLEMGKGKEIREDRLIVFLRQSVI